MYITLTILNSFNRHSENQYRTPVQPTSVLPGISILTWFVLFCFVLFCSVLTTVVPDAVTDLTVDNVLARSVTIKWTRPHPGDMPITSYRVECNEDANPASSKTATASASATDRAISGLKPYTEYRFRIMAITSVGEGLWSAFITSKTGQAGALSLL